jgi:Flp pilus assembly protein TadB
MATPLFLAVAGVVVALIAFAVFLSQRRRTVRTEKAEEEEEAKERETEGEPKETIEEKRATIEKREKKKKEKLPPIDELFFTALKGHQAVVLDIAFTPSGTVRLYVPLKRERDKEKEKMEENHTLSL